jgi:ABC-type nitrate/sulfonate/bicarbonate transport system substrate-binding protein
MAPDSHNNWPIPPKPRALWLILALVLALASVLAYALWPTPVPNQAVTKVKIAVPMQISSATVIVASGQGLFDKAGVDVISQPFALGRDALQSVLNGQSDLAVVADTPLMFALLDGADISILAGVSQGRRSLAVVGRKDRGIERLQDLQGKSVGLSLGTNLTYFLDALLQVNGVPSNTVK